MTTICYSAILTYVNGKTAVLYGTYAEMGEALMSTQDNGGSGVVLPVVEVD